MSSKTDQTIADSLPHGFGDDPISRILKQNEESATWNLYLLIQSIYKTKERFKAINVDVLGLMASPPKSEHPEITEAKLKVRKEANNHIISSLSWLTGSARPWMKPRGRDQIKGLLSCPFCGRAPHSHKNGLIGDAFQWIVECRECLGAQIRSYVSREDAETRWNTRKSAQ